ncbi:uncharacterized protein LOC111325132 [Stylophora pistillata]|uniref:uncharacterized protein LOC111325132 n=1 Tax=Stylophora pistillata TaxID=50429 RepID=UPI000C05462E|nr:uncharacterized protein LOC111325132 [Stylophora pistillata]
MNSNSDQAFSSMMCDRFQYKEGVVNTWFNPDPEGTFPQHIETLNVINVDKDGYREKIYKTQDGVNPFPESLQNTEFDIFLHATTHESAKDILEHGIDLTKGKRKEQDFGPGFYVSDSLDIALSWAKDRGFVRPAVLVFRVKNNELREGKQFRGIDLRGGQQRNSWKEVVKPFLNGQLRKNSHVHYIEGPMVNWKKLSRDNPVQMHSSYQLCVKKDSCAEFFNGSLHSVLFFDGNVL